VTFVDQGDQSCFNDFTMNVITQSRVEAWIRINEEDREQMIITDQAFEIEARYIVGDPAVLDIPFLITYTRISGAELPVIEFLSVTPVNPNVYADASLEQVVTARMIARQEDNPHLSPSQGVRCEFEFEMFQVDLNESVVARHSGADGNVPNVSSRNIGNAQEISWDSPTNEEGEEVGVDVQVIVSTVDSDGNKTRIASDTQTIEYDEHIYRIDWNYLNELVEASGGQMSRTQPAEVEVRLKPDILGTVFNRDDVVLNFLFPFTQRAAVINDALTVDARLKNRLQGGVTEQYLALDFYALAQRQEDIDYFQYRIRQWRDVPDSDNPFQQPEPAFTEWTDVAISTRSRFENAEGDPTRDDIERDEFNNYLGPWGVHGEASPSLLYHTNYIVEARTVNIVDGIHQQNSVRSFTLRTPTEP